MPSTNEIGVSGLKHSYGYVYEEFLRELTGYTGRRKIHEMASNDATIGAILTATGATIRPVDWKIEAADADIEGKYSDWFKGVLDDMDHSFDAWITEALTFLPFGFSISEIVLKKRDGDQNDASRRSKFDDGTYGIRKLAPRSQESIEKWEFSEEGDVLGFHQTDPNNAKSRYIPMSKCIHLRTCSVKNNPEGVSLLRNCYKAYTYLNNIQLIEAIAIERELAGVPVVRVPSEILTDESKAAILAKYKQVAHDLKMGEQGGVVIPSDTYTNEEGEISNVYQVSIELIASQGKRLIDTDVTIKRYQQDIARSILADFLMLGINDRGSFSMSKNKSDIFLNTLQTFTKELARGISDVRDMLWKINSFPEEMKPNIIPGQVNPVNLEVLGNYISKLSTAGILFTDDDTQRLLRRYADLPENVDPDDLVPPPHMMPSNGQPSSEST